MPVEKNESGQRQVQVEIEVPGSPEEVWQAIATAAGVSSWFVPTSTEYGSDGQPIRMTCDFGPGMESVSEITNWDPPHSFSATSKDLGPDAPEVATQWIVESRDGGVCVVRVVHSLFASTDDWDDQLEGWESGWPSFFRLLRLYLAHFSGQPSSLLQLSGMSSRGKSAAWAALLEGLGFNNPRVGQRCVSSDSAPTLAGVVERVGDAVSPEELLLRLDEPSGGIAHIFAMPMGEQVFLSLSYYCYGPESEEIKSREEPLWQAWLQDLVAGEASA